MAACARFEQEFLPAWEARGEVGNEHIRACPECQRSQQIYAQIAAALAVDTAPALSPDWSGRVLQTVASRGRATAAGTESASVRKPPLPNERRRALKWGWSLLGLGLAAAAGLALLIGKRSIVPDFPDYFAEIEGGKQLVRGGEGIPFFRSAAPVTLLLRPGHAVDGDFGARTFVLAGNVPLEIPAEIEHLPKGVMRLRTTVPSVPSGQGKQVSIVVVVARAGWPENHAKEIVLGAAHGGPGWRRLTVKLEIEQP